MVDWLRTIFAGRPGWMNAVMVLCAWMAFVSVPRDFLMGPVAHAEEVWLGILFTGWAAKLTEPLHWAIYAAGAYGFYRLRPWMWPWAAVYAGSVAVAMLVWPLLYREGVGSLIQAGVSFVLVAWLTRALWRAEPLFSERPPALRERYGAWALVTGASAGIGAEFARALAREGVSCVLTARRTDRLRSLAEELEKTWGVETRVVEADLATPGAAAQLVAAVSDLPIALLVSNAGFGAAGRFDEQDLGRLRDMVQLHCTATLELTHALLPGMRQRGRGGVIFTGSIAGRQPLPLHATYAATKAFQQLLGEALDVELRESGIDVLVLEPGVTRTEFQELAGEKPMPGDSPAWVVDSALAALGRQASIIPGWLDWLRANAERLAPRRLVAHLARDVFAKRLP